MKEVAAFSPGHITGFFQICDQGVDPLLKGSRGSGISVSKGVTTRVSMERAPKTSFEIKINSVVRSAKVSKHVLEAFLPHIGHNYKIRVNHEVEIPIGSGLGSSGAGALSLALALNKAFDLGLSRIKAAQIAHIAEIACNTGLGTVIAETYGGLEIRVKAGAPGIGEVKQIPLNSDYCVVYLHLGPLSTSQMLLNSKLRGQINKLGGGLVEELTSHPNPQKFMELSRSFAEHIGLISSRIRKILKDTDDSGYLCSMAMFGEVVFSLVNREAVEGILNIFRQHASTENNITVVEIDFKGARLL